MELSLNLKIIDSSGVRMRFGDSVLACCAHRTTEENARCCARALAILLDMDIMLLFGSFSGGVSYFEGNGGTIESYIVHGGGG